jgi:hypothetical protein
MGAGAGASGVVPKHATRGAVKLGRAGRVNPDASLFVAAPISGAGGGPCGTVGGVDYAPRRRYAPPVTDPAQSHSHTAAGPYRTPFPPPRAYLPSSPQRATGLHHPR